MTDARERVRAAELMRLTTLALIRTEHSSERALMAWMRTSISLYTFGFSISKLLDYFEAQETGVEFATGLRRLGLALISMGIVALALASIEHLKRVRTMRRLGLPTTSRFSLSLRASVVLLVIGIGTLMHIAGVWSPWL